MYMKLIVSSRKIEFLSVVILQLMTRFVILYILVILRLEMTFNF